MLRVVDERQPVFNRRQQIGVVCQGVGFAERDRRLAVRIKRGGVALAIEVVEVPLERPSFLLHASQPFETFGNFVFVEDPPGACGPLPEMSAARGRGATVLVRSWPASGYP